jgi:hypothetical protein
MCEKQFTSNDYILTHWVALRPDAPYFIILLWLAADDFTHQGESAGA